jgi:serine-type D-Ala-D-Ala carboxypeptidase/endopeptidase (penicillin-binding protein 4)
MKINLCGAFVLLMATLLTTNVSARLPDVVAKALQTEGINAADVSAIARPLDGDTLLTEWQSGIPRSPASIMKLVSTYAALLQLGPDFRWFTNAYVERPIEGDTLKGNLTLKGGGDPRIVIEDLLEWLGSWRKGGLKVIEGNLVIDESLFESIGASTDPFDGDINSPYNVMPYPLLMNFKATKFVFKPLDTGRVEVTLDPPLAGTIIDNAIVLRKEECINRASKITVQELGSKIIRLSGAYSSGCAESERYISVLDHKRFIHSFVKAAWESLGGVLKGDVITGRAAGREWSVWRSTKNMSEIVKDINKFSLNVMTRQVLMQMGHERFKQGATEDRARRAVFLTLEEKGLVFADLKLENGSGLSRAEQISVRSLAKLLTHASRSAVGQVYKESLPVVGVDGTMSKRLTQSGVAGQAWIKTGSINSVNSIAGYVTARSGKRYAVAFIVNSALAYRSYAAQDQFLQWVYENG